MERAFTARYDVHADGQQHRMRVWSAGSGWSVARDHDLAAAAAALPAVWRDGGSRAAGAVRVFVRLGWTR